MSTSQGPSAPEPFFEPLPAPQPAVEAPRMYPQHPWQPPENVIPVRVPVWLEMARTADTVLVLAGMDVYPQGVAYSVRVWLRPGTEPQEDAGHYMPWGEEPRVGWLLEDGTKIGASLSQDAVEEATGPQTTPRLAGLGGAMGEICASWGYWLYPLPAGDTWTLVTEWLARGVAETRVELDARPIHAAAAATAGALWELPTPPEGAEYGWFAYAPRFTAGSTPGEGPTPDEGTHA